MFQMHDADILPFWLFNVSVSQMSEATTMQLQKFTDQNENILATTHIVMCHARPSTLNLLLPIAGSKIRILDDLSSPPDTKPYISAQPHLESPYLQTSVTCVSLVIIDLLHMFHFQLHY